MQRRKFLATVGSLAAGSAVAMGTGAVTSVEADRTVSVAVEDDADAFLGLEPGMDSDLVRAAGSPGVLTIDFNEVKAEGINARATTQLGYAYEADSNWNWAEGDPEDECVFIITNQGSQPHDITLNYYWGGEGGYDTGGGVEMALSHDGDAQTAGNKNGNSYIDEENSYPDDNTVEDVGSGERVYVSLRYWIDTADPDALTPGTMKIVAD